MKNAGITKRQDSAPLSTGSLRRGRSFAAALSLLALAFLPAAQAQGPVDDPRPGGILSLLRDEPAPISDETLTKMSESDLARLAVESQRKGVAELATPAKAKRSLRLASAAYLELHRRGVRSVALYRNLACAEFLADRPARAAWAVECGLLRDPADDVLLKHRAYLRNRSATREGTWYGAIERWQKVAAPWFGAGVVIVSLAGAGFLLASGTEWTRRRIAGAAACVVVAASTWAIAGPTVDVADRALTVSANTPLHTGNGFGYPRHAKSPTIPALTEVRIVHERGAWMRIRTPAGDIGWAPRSQVWPIE